MSTLRTMQAIMIMPPMVGVPDFLICVWGPSSLICWVILIFLSHVIILGPINKDSSIAEITASAVLKVM